MKPQDIEKIANAVLGSLGGARETRLLGCFAISSTQDYTCEYGYECCPEGGGCFECGGLGDFSCALSGVFSCCECFTCPEPGQFSCHTGTGANYFPEEA